jgi:hypothetical protein
VNHLTLAWAQVVPNQVQEVSSDDLEKSLIWSICLNMLSLLRLFYLKAPAGSQIEYDSPLGRT